MESAQHPTPNHGVVHTVPRFALDSEAMVGRHMSRATADELAHEAAHIAALDLGTACPGAEGDGATAPTILISITAAATVTKCTTSSDQHDVINRTEIEVDAVGAEVGLVGALPATSGLHLAAVADLIGAPYDYLRGALDFTDRTIAAAAKRSSASTQFALDGLGRQPQATAALPAANT